MSNYDSTSDIETSIGTDNSAYIAPGFTWILTHTSLSSRSTRKYLPISTLERPLTENGYTTIEVSNITS